MTMGIGYDRPAYRECYWDSIVVWSTYSELPQPLCMGSSDDIQMSSCR